MKKIIHIQKNNQQHWVGDGFPVRSIFTYNDLGKVISPFLMMDYAGPAEFSPTTERRGVGEHPHRGFETVTIVYHGEVEHRDSAGGGGLIKPGDVQWMTAASGLVHEEFHGKEFAEKGGRFEMVQLWVNLPKKYKRENPRYQGIKSETIPVLNLPNEAGTLRVIAGEYNDVRGPALTFSPMNLWDIRAKAGAKISLNIPLGHNANLFVLNGKIKTAEGKAVTDAELAVFEQNGLSLSFTAEEESTLLFLGGEPINEPIVGYGPFVMNTPEEIREAFTDYQSGKMGHMPGHKPGHMPGKS